MNALEEEFDKLSDFILDEKRIDKQWFFIGQVRDENKNLKFKLLSSVMLGIAVLPHSNTDCERMFSQVRKNRTDFRPSLSDATLESLIVKKLDMVSTPCYEQRYNDAELRKFKSATYQSMK